MFQIVHYMYLSENCSIYQLDPDWASAPAQPQHNLSSAVKCKKEHIQASGRTSLEEYNLSNQELFPLIKKKW